MTELQGPLAAQNSAFPQFKEAHEKLQNLSDKKLYHELTNAMDEYLALDIWREKAPCKQIHNLFEGFIRPLLGRVNPLRFQQLLAFATEHTGSPEESLKLVDSFKEHVEEKSKTGVDIFYRALRTDCLVALKMFKEAKALLDEIDESMKTVYDVDAAVHSRFYYSQLKLFEATKDSQNFFTAAINYLNYTPTQQIRDAPNFAYNVILSCLTSPNEFDFGDLLQREFLSCLDGHPFEWAKTLLIAFHEGKYQAYDEAMKNHGNEMDKVPELKNNKSVLEQKFSLMALVELAFQQPKKQRKLDFKQIAKVCRVDENRVEHLLMRAMSLSLIKGKIDQVSETLSFTWVKPRILDNMRLRLLQSRIDTWHIQANTVLLQLEEMTNELLVS